MKKGFTLIELLAVIVILAIIALIAIPTITGLVEKARKGSVEQSANGYIDAVNKQIAINQMDSDDSNDINKGIIDAPFDSKYNLKVKGQTPTKGWVEVLKDGINRYSLVIGEYVITYDGENTTVIKGTEPAEKPSIPIAFATDSWPTIIEAVRNNNTSMYHVGDTKEVDMGTFGKHTVRISNMSTPSECSTEGFSQTACGFVLEFSDIITEYNMNSTATNDGGWPATSMRTYVNSDIFNSLPSDLKIGIIDTFVVSGHGSNDSANFTSIDKLYLLSAKEVYDKLETSNTVSKDSAEAETRQLDYYKNNGVTTSNYSDAIKKSSGVTGSIWWLRSSISSINYSFFYIDGNGDNRNTTSSKYANGVSPAFRIG